MSGSIYTSVFGTGTPSAPVPSVSGLDETAGAAVFTVKANTQHAQKVTDATTTLLDQDSRNTVTAVIGWNFGACPPTITAASGVVFSQMGIAAITVTLTGATGVTALDGLGLYIDVPTVTDASGVTVTTLSNLYVALPVAGGSVTGTNIYAAHFAGAVLIDGNIVVNSAAATIKAKANTAATLAISDGTTNIVAVDSRNTIANVSNVTLTAVNPTIASATAAHINASLNLAAKTITYSGGTATTSSLGTQLYVAQPTVTDSTSMTLTSASVVHISQLAAAGGSLTITNSYMISTGVSDCFLTNAGVWTDHACFADGKAGIVNAAREKVQSLIEALTPRTWLYRADMHGDDFGRERVGIVYDELPDELRAPGQVKAVSPGLLASFALAGLKVLFEENQALKDRIARLERGAA